jgi:hypothetical protein
MKINKEILLHSFHLKTIKRQYIYLSREDSEAVLVFERNDASLKKLSKVLCEQTSDSSPFPNATRLLQCVPNCEQHFLFFIFPSGSTVTGLARLYSNLNFIQSTYAISLRQTYIKVL